MERLRAWGRLIRLAMHALHCIAVCAFVFPFLGAPARMRRVGWACAKALRCLGIALHTQGAALPGPVLLVANHVSWLDILAVNAVRPVRFVSKADVQGWPVLGWIIACGGTLFIQRERKRDAMRVLHQVADALRAGDVIAVFPEGTTGDARALLPFHANLLQAAITTSTVVQPVALHYSDARAPRSEAALWIGATTLMDSLWRIARADRLSATVRMLDALPAAGLERRALVQRASAAIARALDADVIESKPQPRA
ncbi:MAG: lysophospholipid acyltransferase family protein [Burkholderiaceae bacterium]